WAAPVRDDVESEHGGERLRGRRPRFADRDDAVDVGRAKPGVADRHRRCLEAEGQGTALAPAREAGTSDAHDGDTVLDRVPSQSHALPGEAHGPERRVWAAVALDPGHLDRHPDADLRKRAIDHRARESETLLLGEVDGHDRVRCLRVVDTVGGWTLVQKHEEMHGPATAQGRRLDVSGPARGTHGPHGMVPSLTIRTAIHDELATQVPA